ncbi:MAG: hypothetical protein II139_05725 [Lachnospiraceae bacterium]|nr:hypothetical protein [Lachnospiraceae bacterium]
MNCKNCNAVMRVDHEKKVFRCPYCDSEEPFDGVSKAELQGMLRDAIVDVRKESFNEAKKTLSAAQSYKDTRTKGRKVWDGIVLILQALLCVILGICCIGFFIDYVGLGFVSLIQLGLMIAIILTKLKYLQTGEQKLLKRKNIFLIIFCVLIIGWFVALLNEGGNGASSSRKASWPNQGLGSDLPEPDGKLKYTSSSKSYFNATVKDYDRDKFSAYVEACKEAGYNLDAQASDTEFDAYDEDDNHLTLNLWTYSDELNVQVDRGIVLTTYAWPSSALAEKVPKIEAEKSSLEKLNTNSFTLIVGDVTREQFVNYVMEIQEAGFKGYYNAGDNDYYGTLDSVSIRVEYLRNRLLSIEVYELNR